MAYKLTSLVVAFFCLVSVARAQLRFRIKDVEAATSTAAPKQVMEFDQNNHAICPGTGIYEDPLFCDAYWKCNSVLVPKEIFCADGLVFDSRKSHHADPCDTPFVVDCGTRHELQEPTFPNEVCPRRHGTFEHPDPTVCNIYYQCVDAKPQEIVCPGGLYFNGTQGTCNWPHISDRAGCIDEVPMSADGTFVCPSGPHVDSNRQDVPHPSFPNPEDCTKFYVCLNGITPQDASCNRGQVFDEASMICALPDTVPECAGWFADDPEFAHYYDDLPATGRAADPGTVDFTG